MDPVIDKPKSRMGIGFASLIIGIVALSIYILGLVAVSLAVLAAGNDPSARGMLVLLALTVGPVIPFAGAAANVVGLVLGIIAWLRTPATNQRRLGILGVAINLLPALLFCILMFWGFGAFGSSGWG